MSDVRLENVSKHYGKVVAVANFREQIRDGEFVSLLGPSGCGKTTTLRIIAGFEKATGGRVFIGNELVSCSETNLYVPPEKRNIGMVFQSYAVWPHMNVFDNVGYPLKVRRVDRKTMRAKVERVLDLVHLAGLGAIRTHEIQEAGRAVALGAVGGDFFRIGVVPVVKGHRGRIGVTGTSPQILVGNYFHNRLGALGRSRAIRARYRRRTRNGGLGGRGLRSTGGERQGDGSQHHKQPYGFLHHNTS